MSDLILDDDGAVIMSPSGRLLLQVHSATRCAGDVCVVHNPSDHPMRPFPLHWRDDRAMFERICPHGVGHPDPDQVAYWEAILHGDDAWAMGVHGCCASRCCASRCCAAPSDA